MKNHVTRIIKCIFACSGLLISGSVLQQAVAQDGNPIIAQGDYAISIGGGQPETTASVATGHFHIDGQYALAE
jgi:uncharacterized Zn-binding protein involved in type VI secretion